MSTNSSTGTGNPGRGNSIGAGLGTAVNGAFRTVQGVSNNVRGNLMDFVDSATGTAGRRHPETDVGHRQTEEGIERMEAGRHSHGAPDTAASSRAQPSATSTAAPPLPPRGLDGSLGAKNGGTVGNDGMGGQIRSNV